MFKCCNERINHKSHIIAQCYVRGGCRVKFAPPPPPREISSSQLTQYHEYKFIFFILFFLFLLNDSLRILMYKYHYLQKYVEYSTVTLIL